MRSGFGPTRSKLNVLKAAYITKKNLSLLLLISIKLTFQFAPDLFEYVKKSAKISAFCLLTFRIRVHVNIYQINKPYMQSSHLRFTTDVHWWAIHARFKKNCMYRHKITATFLCKQTRK